MLTTNSFHSQTSNLTKFLIKSRSFIRPTILRHARQFPTTNLLRSLRLSHRTSSTANIHASHAPACRSLSALAATSSAANPTTALTLEPHLAPRTQLFWQLKTRRNRTTPSSSKPRTSRPAASALATPPEQLNLLLFR